MNALVVGGANHTLTRSEIHISHVLSTVIRVHSDRTATGFAVALAQDTLKFRSGKITYFFGFRSNFLRKFLLSLVNIYY